MADPVDGTILDYLADYRRTHPVKPFAGAWEVGPAVGLSREDARDRLRQLTIAGVLEGTSLMIGYGYRIRL